MTKFLALLSFLFVFQSCASQSSSQLIDDGLKTIVEEQLNYYLYLPKNYETSENKKFPLLLFLHGGGESGENLTEIKKNGPPKLIANGKEFPFLILAPQNPNKNKWWNTRAVNQLLDSIVLHNRVDTNRIYLTGLSRGGAAAWEMAVHYPDKFAAMAVVCGMTPVPYASWIDKKMPIWVFHGEEDQSVPISESENMVARLEEMGYTVKFTKYAGVGHDSWIQAYAGDSLYDWFMEQKRKE